MHHLELGGDGDVAAQVLVESLSNNLGHADDGLLLVAAADELECDGGVLVMLDVIYQQAFSSVSLKLWRRENVQES